MPLVGLRGPPPVDLWRKRVDVAELLDRLCRCHDLRPEHRRHAESLVHTSLTAPAQAGGLVLPALGDLDRVLREVDFVFPNKQGMVQGVIDVLLEHEGRVYVCDWKSDWLPAWRPEALAEHCAQRYLLQAQIYTVAAIRWLGIEHEQAFHDRFGGVLYRFVRALKPDDPGAGVFYQKPSWADVLKWQDEIHNLPTAN
jgi:ATP-dependent exoDNAse (exonuclease V) beta subunit